MTWLYNIVHAQSLSSLNVETSIGYWGGVKFRHCAASLKRIRKRRFSQAPASPQHSMAASAPLPKAPAAPSTTPTAATSPAPPAVKMATMMAPSPKPVAAPVAKAAPEPLVKATPPSLPKPTHSTISIIKGLEEVSSPPASVPKAAAPVPVKRKREEEQPPAPAPAPAAAAKQSLVDESRPLVALLKELATVTGASDDEQRQILKLAVDHGKQHDSNYRIVREIVSNWYDEVIREETRPEDRLNHSAYGEPKLTVKRPKEHVTEYWMSRTQPFGDAVVFGVLVISMRLPTTPDHPGEEPFLLAVNYDAHLPPSALHTCESTKPGGANCRQVGEYGEGIKLAALNALRYKWGMLCLHDNQISRFTIAKKEDNANCVAVCSRLRDSVTATRTPPDDSRRHTVAFYLRGAPAPAGVAFFEERDFLFLLPPEHPLMDGSFHASAIKTVLLPKMPGRLYAKGVFVHLDASLHVGFSCNKAPVTRDRTAFSHVARHTLQQELLSTWAAAIATYYGWNEAFLKAINEPKRLTSSFEADAVIRAATSLPQGVLRGLVTGLFVSEEVKFPINPAIDKLEFSTGMTWHATLKWVYGKEVFDASSAYAFIGFLRFSLVDNKLQARADKLQNAPQIVHRSAVALLAALKKDHGIDASVHTGQDGAALCFMKDKKVFINSQLCLSQKKLMAALADVCRLSTDQVLDLVTTAYPQAFNTNAAERGAAVPPAVAPAAQDTDSEGEEEAGDDTGDNTSETIDRRASALHSVSDLLIEYADLAQREYRITVVRKKGKETRSSEGWGGLLDITANWPGVADDDQLTIKRKKVASNRRSAKK